MIITETFINPYDGVELLKIYSDEGRYVVCDGRIYEEVVDSLNSNRTYTEGDPIISEDISAEDALDIITGVSE